MDVKGALKFNKVCPDANFLAILPPGGKKTLEERLCGRKTESEEQMRTRLAGANEELETITNMPEIFSNRIVNDDLDESKRVIELLISGMYYEELFGEDTEDEDVFEESDS